jgi:hypothetical protein
MARRKMMQPAAEAPLQIKLRSHLYNLNKRLRGAELNELDLDMLLTAVTV